MNCNPYSYASIHENIIHILNFLLRINEQRFKNEIHTFNMNFYTVIFSWKWNYIVHISHVHRGEYMYVYVVHISFCVMQCLNCISSCVNVLIFFLHILMNWSYFQWGMFIICNKLHWVFRLKNNILYYATSHIILLFHSIITNSFSTNRWKCER